jgi:hypothetical protein
MSFVKSISCDGAKSLGIDKFNIVCDREFKRNAKNIDINGGPVDHVFNWVEIQYKTCERSTLVRVLGIVCFIENKTSYYSLLVLRMTPAIGESLFQYSGTKSKGFDIDVVDLEVVVRPTCVIPQFTTDFQPNYKEKFSDIWNGAMDWKFNQVPIHSHHLFQLLQYNEIVEKLQRANSNVSYQKNQKYDSNHGHHLFLSEKQLNSINEHQNILIREDNDSDSEDSLTEEENIHDKNDEEVL